MKELIIMPSIGKYFRFSEGTCNKLTQLARKKRVTQTELLESLIDDAVNQDEIQKNLIVVETERIVEQKIQEHILPILNRLVVIGNVVDRNGQMMLEFWNHYFVMSQAKTLGSTDKYKTVPFEEAEQLIKSRIAHNRQKKLDWEAKRKGSNSQSE